MFFYRNRLIFVIFFQFIVFATFAQQSVLEEKISIEVDNLPVYMVLEKIEQKVGFNFSFNSMLFDKQKRISISFINKSILEILREIITDKTLVYREHGTQIIIYKPTRGDLIGKPIHIQPEIKESQKLEIVYDTIYEYTLVTDTLYHIKLDTNTVFDTIVVMDTNRVTVSLPQTLKKQSQAFRVSASVLYTDIAYSETSKENAGLVHMYNTQNAPTLSLGMECSYVYGEKIKTRFGLGLYYEREKNNMSVVNAEPVFSLSIDTTFTLRWQSSYYEYIGSDTILHNVYDSVMQINETKIWDTITETLENKKTSSLLYLTLPVVTSFTVFRNEKMIISLAGGFICKFLLYKNGSYFQYKDKYVLNSYDSGYFKACLVDLYFAPSFSYSLSKNIFLQIEPHMLWGLQSSVKKANLYERKTNNYGLSLSIVKKI